MNNWIPEEFIEEVRRQTDIVDLISEYVMLKRTGKNYMGICPFHSEKTPSFNVNPDRQTFYCFGCNTGGDVFSFLMKINNLTFLEALNRLAERAGLELPEKELTPEQKERRRKLKRFKEIHEYAAAYFHDVLLNRPEGRVGLRYLAQRGIDTNTIKFFRLGYAPDQWDGLLKELQSKGVSPEELVEYGLAIKKSRDEQGHPSYYDRFRGRFIFTILDSRSSPIAFGARVLDDSLPKYLNSPETPFFHKGHNLYGIHYAQRGIRERGYALLLEGYMDTIAACKAGFTNAVASLGTALTKDQAKLLKKYADKVVIGYDSDSAGVKATLRAGEILLEQGLRVEVLILEEAKDPDDFLKNHSAEEFQAKVDNAVTFIEFKYYALVKDNPPRAITDKAELVKKMAPDILKIKSAVEREGYERFLSLKLGLSLEAIRYEINSLAKQTKEKFIKTENFSLKQDISVKNRNTIGGTKIDSIGDSFVPLGVIRAEQMLIRLVLDNPDFKIKVLERLGDDFWRLKEHKIIFDNLPDRSFIGFIHEDLLYQRIQQRLADIYELEIESTEAQALLEDCVSSIEANKNRETIEEMQARMIKLEKSGDIAGALAVLQEIGERLRRG